jgi:hypothetical protein
MFVSNKTFAKGWTQIMLNLGKSISLETYLNDDTIEKRIESTYDKIAKTEWYNNLLNKLIEIQNRSPEIKKALPELNATREEIFRGTATEIYRQAFIDGAKASKTMTPILAPKLQFNLDSFPVWDKQKRFTFITCCEIQKNRYFRKQVKQQVPEQDKKIIPQDLKSCGGNIVPVRFRSSAPKVSGFSLKSIFMP